MVPPSVSQGCSIASFNVIRLAGSATRNFFSKSLQSGIKTPSYGFQLCIQQLSPPPGSVDYFHFHPASLSTEVAETKRQMARSPSQHLLMHHNSQWNAAVDWPSRVARATVKGMPRWRRHADIRIVRSANVQWLARSELTTGWWSIVYKEWKPTHVRAKTNQFDDVISRQYSRDDTWSGSGFISPFCILECRVLMLNGSTVNGKLPVNMAYILTPLCGRKQTWYKRHGRSKT